jgi:hypothetical protein
MTRNSLILSAALGLAALPLFLACSDDPMEPQGNRLAAEKPSITVSPGLIDVKVGQTIQLTATITDVNGEVVARNAVHWSSSDPGVATVLNGRVHGKRPGHATITAGCSGMCGWAEVTVSEWDEGEEDTDNGVH